MNLSELIAKYGDENVSFQRVDDCVTDMNMTRNGTRASFVTPERIGLDGFDKMGLIVWLDREKVKAIIAKAKAATPDTGE